MLSAGLKTFFAAALGAATLAAPAAQAGTGGTSAPNGGSSSPASGTSSGGTSTGGARPGSATPTQPSSPPRSGTTTAPRKAPTLTAFSLSSTRLYAYGSPVRVTFRIDGRMKSLPVTLRVLSGSQVVRSVPLGTLATGMTQTYALAPDATLPAGALALRISAKGLRRGPHASGSEQVTYATHRFPLVGAFTYGDGFGVDRPGHMHQGVDLLAAQGTPIVAPRGGTVTQVAYQSGGAGYYVVVSGSGEDYDYVFMHLVKGSTRVRTGQVVRTGQRLGDVGSTGASSGAHLHFEVWQGTWQAGGHPVDPLPLLKRWRAQA
jgi:murein DD-endopeptidase MepM/ murein hydrolase activator NlpD